MSEVSRIAYESSEVGGGSSYHIVKADVVFEGKGSGEAGRDCEVLAGDDLEKLERVLGFLLFLLEKGLSYQTGLVLASPAKAVAADRQTDRASGRKATFPVLLMIQGCVKQLSNACDVCCHVDL